MALPFLTNSSYSVFLTTSFFTTSLSLLKSACVVPDLPIFNLSTLCFKLLKSLRTFSNSSMSSLSVCDFKVARSAFSTNCDVSTFVVFFS